MKEKMQNDIIHALTVIEIGGILEEKERKDKDGNKFKVYVLPNEYKGYISSYGAAVGQSGLLPATMFFSEKGNDKTKKMRCRLMRAIYAVLKNETPKTDSDNQDHILLNYAKANFSNRKNIQKVLDAAIALKMAMRGFESSESA